jgi:hypothetical protein
VKIPEPFQDGDGKISSHLDGAGINVTLSLLYEFTDQPRAACQARLFVCRIQGGRPKSVNRTFNRKRGLSLIVPALYPLILPA